MAKSYETAPPTAEAETNERTPIGVGSDYTPEFTGLTQDPAQTKVRYYSGHERTEVANLSPEDRAELQLTLRSLGLIGPKTKIQLGLWDDTSATAFRQVLGWANTKGIGWRAALADMEQTASLGSLGSVGGEEAAAALPANPLDVRALGRKAGTEVLGRGLTDAERATFEQKFRAMESGQIAGTAAFDAPDPNVFAEEQVRALDPVKADSRSAVKVAGVISRMLGGESSFEGGI